MVKPLDLPTRSWVVLLVVPLILGTVGVVVFANSLNNPFLFDDFDAVVENPSLRSLSPVSSAFWAPKDSPLAGRPIVNVTFAVNYAVGEFRTSGYHAVNLGLHLLNACLVFGVTNRSLRMPVFANRFESSGTWIALGTAALWMIHPLQTEVINYVTQRTEILLGLFYLLTLYASIRAWNRPGLWAPVAVVSCAWGMISKESMVTAPVLVVVYDWALSGQPLARLWRERRKLYVSLAATWTVLAVVMLSAPRSGSVGFDLGISPWDYALTQCWVIGRYVRLTVWPSDLLIDYGNVPHTDLAAVLPGAIVITLLIVAALLCWNRFRPMAFAILAYFLLLSPTSSIVPIATEMGAERRVYLPLVAACAAAVVAFAEVVRRLGNRERKRSLIRSASVAVIVGFVFIALAVRSYVRNSEYSDTVELWRSATRIAPHNVRAPLNLSQVLSTQGRWEEALAAAQRAVEIAPDLMESLCSLSGAQAELGLYQDAAESARRAVELSSTQAEPHRRLAYALMNLGSLGEAETVARRGVEITNGQDALSWLALHRVLMQQQRLQEAEQAARAAIALDDGLTEARLALSHALMDQGQVSQSLEQAESAIHRDGTNAKAHVAAALVLRRTGRFDEALAATDRAIKLDPRLASAWYERGNAFRVQGKTNEAIECYRKAVSFNSGFADAHNNLGVLVARTDPRGAIAHLKTAVRCNPNHDEAYANLGNTWIKLGQIDAAIKCYQRAIELDPTNAQATQNLQVLQRHQQERRKDSSKPN